MSGHSNIDFNVRNSFHINHRHISSSHTTKDRKEPFLAIIPCFPPRLSLNVALYSEKTNLFRSVPVFLFSLSDVIYDYNYLRNNDYYDYNDMHVKGWPP